MSYIGVKISGLREKIAGMPLMDVAFSNRSTNGLQNKIITAKKDEIEGRLNDVETDLTANTFGTAIDLTQQTIPFTFPSDGYVRIANLTSAGEQNVFVGIGNGSTNAITLSIKRNDNTNNAWSESVFVRKGMNVTELVVVGGVARYYPLS